MDTPSENIAEKYPLLGVGTKQKLAKAGWEDSAEWSFSMEIGNSVLIIRSYDL
jgi:hypothetical protein